MLNRFKPHTCTMYIDKPVMARAGTVKILGNNIEYLSIRSAKVHCIVCLSILCTIYWISSDTQNKPNSDNKSHTLGYTMTLHSTLRNQTY